MDIILKYFPDLNSIQIENLKKLELLYKDWNDKINIISRKDIDKLCERHVLHSLSIAKYIDFQKNTSILDIGTGGGFPGIPLAILFPDVKFHLVDSIGKKIKVVNEIVDELNLKNVIAEHNHSSQLKGNYDFIVSRAVTAFPAFVELVKDRIKTNGNNKLINGIIYLKGGNLDEELKKFKKKVIITPIKDYFEEDFFESKYIVYLPF
ncbi:MAG: 16S rRNA (guanine(527)-N(7))-methyltransferase RsmG [Bacteroidales bacterium]|nr:16S rRNA (guanine(527)-N(7))-methyltransferase RsmG [Bacteroidales bacterium]MBN2756593.1 16S rRNA (guanine(527)-N(7))-methyltransferase RsmG [Bacteroidales bacterium]